MNSQQRKSLERQLLAAVDLARSLTMDSLEVEYGETSSWTFVRSRILKVFGSRGLTARIQEILDAEGRPAGEQT